MDISEEGGKEYELSSIIRAHQSDVKCVLATGSGQIISCSRDETVKMFSENEGAYVENISVGGDDRLAVNAVAFYECSNTGWLIFAGRKDGSIAVYSAGDPKPKRILHEHKMNVCVLYVDAENGRLLSGSWDGTAIVWPVEDIINRSEFQALCLVGHKMSVWAVASIPGKRDFYLTASADLTIKYWKDDNELSTFSGHDDVVRSLVVISAQRFLSAANDYTIRLWHLESGVCLQKYSSLSAEYIYSLAHSNILGQNLIANSGEGGFLELWKMDDDGLLSHKQLIRTPAQSLWSIVFLKNGDLAVGADDGNIYIFTTNAKRKANTTMMEMYQCAVAKKIADVDAALAAQQSETVTIKVALDDGQPNIELRYKKGSDPYDAAQTFLMENDLPGSYLNEVAEYIIENIPEARQAVNKKLAQKLPKHSSKKVVLDGKEYDRVFDISTNDGRVLKLPFNKGDDINWVAQRFVEKHNLPIKTLGEITSFLRRHTIGDSSSTSSGFGNFSDPFVESRYVPGASSHANGTTGFVDPFTGGNAYVSSSGAAMPSASLPIDKKRPKSEFVPLGNFYQFGIEQASAKAIVKLRELNEQQSEHKLNEEQLRAMEDVLKSSTYEPRDIHVSAIDSGLRWNMDTIVPILDVFRLALLNRTLNRIYCALTSEGEKSARGLETMQRLTNFLISATSDPVRILACRAMANAASHQWGRALFTHDVNTTVTVVAAQLGSPKPALQLAAATALANWALVLLRQTESGKVAELGPREDSLRAIIQAIENVTSFGDYNQAALLRLLQAIVTLMWGDITVIRLAKGRNIITIANRIKDAVVDEAGKDVARDITEMAYSL